MVHFLCSRYRNIVAMLGLLLGLIVLVPKFTNAQWTPVGNYRVSGVFNNIINYISQDKSGNIYVGGHFTNAKGNQYIAKWNGSVWSEVGGTNASTFNGDISTLATDANGNLYVGGNFVNGNGYYYILKWDGTIWSEVGGTNKSTFNGIINNLTTDMNGNVFAGGDFTNANGNQYIAKWNGSAWSEVGGTNKSTFNSSIYKLTIDVNGNLYTGGDFKNANGIHYIAKWNGAVWTEVGGTNKSTFNDVINTLTTDAIGNLYIGGYFTNANGYQYIAKWNGSVWSEIGGTNKSTFNSQFITLSADRSGNLYGGGTFTNGNGNSYIAKWNGSVWSEVGGTNKSTFDATIFNTLTTDSSGSVYVGGYFKNSNGQYYIAKWNGSAWSEVGGTNTITFGNNGFNSLTTDLKGNIYAGGASSAGTARYKIVQWNGSSWNTIDGDLFDAAIFSLTSDANNNLYAGGFFFNSNGKQYIAKWNGSAWSEVGGTNASTFNNEILTVITDASGNLYAGGYFTNGSNYYIAKWNGSVWSEVGGTNTSTFNGFINTLTTDASGNIYAGGRFTNGNGKYYIAKWNGSVWSEVSGINTSTFNGQIFALTTDASGNIYAGGAFTNANGYQYIAKWNGSVWSEVGGTNTSTFNGFISTLTTDASGNIYAGGAFTNGSGNNYIAQWNGSIWSEVGGTNTSTFKGNINTLCKDASGNLYTAGNFILPNVSYKTYYVAKYTNKIISPTITSFNPKTAYQGSTISIKGHNFTGTNSVSFGGVPAGSFTVVNDSTITAVVGVGASGKLKITSASGSDSLGGFNYLVAVNGSVHHANGKIISNVSVKNNGTNLKTTDAQGNYSIDLSDTIANTIRVNKNNDLVKANGNTLNDILQVQGHILKKFSLNSPYKLIAADVNNSGTITTLDILIMKRLILGLDTSFAGNRLWTFVDSSYQFPDSTNPFPYKDSIALNYPKTNKTAQSFIGIKLGDVNWDWNNTILGNQPQGKAIELFYQPILASNSNEITIPIKAKNFQQMMGMQFTLNFNPQMLQLKSINNASKLPIEFATNHSNEGKISCLWTDDQMSGQTLNDSTVILNLVFQKLGTVSGDALSLSSDITKIEGLDNQFVARNITLSSNKILAEDVLVESLAISPNPTKGIINVTTQVSKAETVSFQLLDPAGKIYFQQQVDIAQGKSSLHLNLKAQHRLLSGVYYLQVIGMSKKVIKRVLVIL